SKATTHVSIAIVHPKSAVKARSSNSNPFCPHGHALDGPNLLRSASKMSSKSMSETLKTIACIQGSIPSRLSTGMIHSHIAYPCDTTIYTALHGRSTPCPLSLVPLNG